MELGGSCTAGNGSQLFGTSRVREGEMMKLGPYELGPNDTPENGIYTGDARELAKAIPDESVDLIFTDPVYDRIEDYAWLAETAARVLKPDSACLFFYGIGYLPETLNAVNHGKLNYRWQGIWYQSNNMQRADMGFCNYSPFLWLDKGKSKVVTPMEASFTVVVED